MGQQIIKQPNGKYALWSYIVDDFVLLDATPEEIIKARIKTESRIIERSVMRVIEGLNYGEEVYGRFTKTFEEAIKSIKERHGTNRESLKLIKKHKIGVNRR